MNGTGGGDGGGAGADIALDGSGADDSLCGSEELSTVELVGVSASLVGIVTALEGKGDFPWSSGEEKTGQKKH